MAFDNEIADDFGLEVIRKAAIENPDGSETKYSLATKGSSTGTFSLAGLGIGKIRQVDLNDADWLDVTTYLVDEGVGAGINYVFVQNISGNGNIILWNYEDNAPDQDVGIRIEDSGYRTTLLKDSTTSKVYIKMLDGTGTATLEGLAP